MKFKKVLFFCISALLLSFVGHAQSTINVTGKVTDETGLPLPGTTVSLKGTQSATMTDIDGNYQISAPSDGTLVFSFIGYVTIEMAIEGKTVINANFKATAENLEEVVVIGYGTQKKSVTTGAISGVKASQLENQPINRIEQALQGRTSGVIVAADSGQPGSSATVRIRGIATLNDPNPLYVVDGILMHNTDVAYLSQDDIESIEVLKDASGSIYGTVAGSGVILITTKKGKAGKIRVNYSGFAGFSGPAKKMNMLNATQYATLRNESVVNSGGTTLPYADPQSLGKGTNWQDYVFSDNAARESHEFSISGGNDISNFFASFSLVDQEGIVMPSISRYMRKTVRLNSTHKITKYITFGQTASYTHEKTWGVGNTNSEYGGPLSSALNLDPTTPAVVTDYDASNPAYQIYNNTGVWFNNQGQPYGISTDVGQEMSNPLAYEKTRQGNYGYADNFTANAYLEAELIKGLKFRSTASGKLAYYGNEGFNPVSYLNPSNTTPVNSIYRNSYNNLYWSIENTLNYNKVLGKHDFTVLLGQASYVWGGERGQSTTYKDIPVDNWQDASFNFEVPTENQTTSAYTNADHKITSLFGRLLYNYDEKYLAQGIIRRDGSTKFGANNKFGVFPSVLLGWVPSKESFWPENEVIDMLKIRGSYGVSGNDNATEDYAYAALVEGGYNYTFGNQGNVTIGNFLDRPANPDLKWEETTNRNIGFETTLFKSLNITFDLYEKKTTGIITTLQIPGYVGYSNDPLYNNGEMSNTGWEIEVSYRKKIGDVNISLAGNFSTVKNRVVSISEGVDFQETASFQSMGNMSRAAIGHSYGAFYGYVSDGIFQNQAEIDSYVSPSGTAIQPDARPGDFKWEDLDGNGTITGNDRTFIGSPVPKFTYGLTLNLDYKNFDLSIFTQGAAGNDIFAGYRRLDILKANYTTDALGRWTGEGTSNTHPILSDTDANGNFTKMSKFYLKDGDYFRFKTVQVGYSLPKDVIAKAGLDKVRLFVTGENLWTFTKYNGYDPEIGGNVLGIDRGYYPQARSYMVGLNLQF